MKPFEQFFLPWKWEQEEDIINTRSREGYHLVARSLFARKEKYCDTERYCYRLDCKQENGFTELLYQKQGWELVCKRGSWLFFRKPFHEDEPVETYTLYRGDGMNAITAHLNRLCKLMDRIRNLLLLIIVIMVLIPQDFVPRWNYRYSVIPMLLFIGIVKYTGEIRKLIGEETQIYTEYK